MVNSLCLLLLNSLTDILYRHRLQTVQIKYDHVLINSLNILFLFTKLSLEKFLPFLQFLLAFLTSVWLGEPMNYECILVIPCFDCSFALNCCRMVPAIIFTSAFPSAVRFSWYSVSCSLFFSFFSTSKMFNLR